MRQRLWIWTKKKLKWNKNSWKIKHKMNNTETHNKICDYIFNTYFMRSNLFSVASPSNQNEKLKINRTTDNGWSKEAEHNNTVVISCSIQKILCSHSTQTYTCMDNILLILLYWCLYYYFASNVSNYQCVYFLQFFEFQINTLYVHNRRSMCFYSTT